MNLKVYKFPDLIFLTITDKIMMKVIEVSLLSSSSAFFLVGISQHLFSSIGY